ncbi:MAG: CIA30 family protein [Phormidesmis sp.]
MSNSRSSNRRSQWDAGRFLATLGHFGEVPFLGSFRWLQQLAGQNPVSPGMTMIATKKVAIVGDNGLSPKLIATLKTRLGSAVELVVIKPTVSFSEWGRLARSVDVVVVDVQDLNDKVSKAEKSDVFSFLASLLLKDGLGVSVLGAASDTDETNGALACVAQSIFNFSESSCDLSAWGALDDVVMGGVSEGCISLRRLDAADNVSQDEILSSKESAQNAISQYAAFAGNVSTDNSGGFSSVRTKNFEPPFDFLGWAGIRLRVKGDGQRYKFILRNSGGWDSPAYIYSFDTVADEWQDVYVPFEEMVATFRAKSVPDAPNLDPQKVFSFQLMLSKFEYDKRLNPSFVPGVFELAILDLSVYRPRTGVPLVVVGAQDADTRRQQRAALEELSIPYQLLEINEVNETTCVEAISQALL